MRTTDDPAQNVREFTAGIVVQHDIVILLDQRSQIAPSGD